jgi:hypothetical protein
VCLLQRWHQIIPFELRFSSYQMAYIRPIGFPKQNPGPEPQRSIFPDRSSRLKMFEIG